MHCFRAPYSETVNTYPVLTEIRVPEIQIDILAKVLNFQKWLRQSGPGGTDRDFEASS